MRQLASEGKRGKEREEASKKAFEEIRITRFAGFNEEVPFSSGDYSRECIDEKRSSSRITNSEYCIGEAEWKKNDETSVAKFSAAAFNRGLMRGARIMACVLCGCWADWLVGWLVGWMAGWSGGCSSLCARLCVPFASERACIGSDPFESVGALIERPRGV